MFKKLRNLFRKKVELDENDVPGPYSISFSAVPDNPKKANISITSDRSYPITLEVEAAMQDFAEVFVEWRNKCLDGTVWETVLEEQSMDRTYLN
jgi:hypothetical protein